jgi:hypothetical protein
MALLKRRQPLGLLLIAAVLAAASAAGAPWVTAVNLQAQAPRGTLEDQVKAAYIYNFVAFTEWPATAFSDPAAPLRICLAGDEAFGATLESTVRGERVLGHPVTVEPLSGLDHVVQCHVLFIGRAPAARATELIKAADDSPVLTIGESSTFLKSGGIVNFVSEAGHVRFDVNRSRFEAQGLRLSSRLLKLARSVN